MGGENEMEWKGIKRIILEYSSLPLFGSFNGGNGKLIPLFRSFNGGNGKLIPLFGSLSKREWNEQEGILIPLYSLKISNFHPSQNWEEWGGGGIKLNLMIFFTKTLKIPLYIQLFILK